MDVCARVSAAAQALGIASPLTVLGELLRLTFARPANDPAYARNRLQPGALPLEWSFSEESADALRIELQPFDTELAPAQRLHGALRMLTPLVHRSCGEPLTHRFCELASAGAGELGSAAAFGAFLGVVLRPGAAPGFKIYLELDPGSETGSAEQLGRITGAVPHFRSVTVGAGGTGERCYFLCREGLRLCDLEAVCTTLGMGDRFPALLVALLELTEGDFHLPPRSALLGVGGTGTQSELKIELLSGVAMNPDGLTIRIERLLQPASLAPFRRWTDFVRPTGPANFAANIVSVRIAARRPARLNVYTAEPRPVP